MICSDFGALLEIIYLGKKFLENTLIPIQDKLLDLLDIVSV
jgi:hypothetical protein